SARPAAVSPDRATQARIAKTVRSWWCGYAPKPCSNWRVTTSGVRLSTVVPKWGYARVTDHPVRGTTDLPPKLRVILEKNASGWHVYRWFIGIRALTCAAAADGIGVPLRAMQDLGLCSLLTTLP